jgi:hypothetical protein
MQRTGNEILPVGVLLKMELFRRRNFDFITVKGDMKHEKQKQALNILTDSEHAEFLYGGAAGGSKSYTGCAWLIFSCLLYPGTRWFVGRNSLKSIRESTLITFYKVMSNMGITMDVYNYNGQDNYLEFTGGSRISMLDLQYLPSDSFYERYGSLEFTGGWIEEGGEVNFNAYDTLKTRIGRHLNDRYGLLRKLFITCNPKKNWMYDVFYRPFTQGSLLERQSYLPCLVHENPFVEKGYIEALSSTSDKVKRERLLNGNWEYDDNPNMLCSYDSIVQMFGNLLAIEDGTFYLTADIARFGADKAIILVWNGYKVVDYRCFQTSKTTEIEECINSFRKKYRIQEWNCIADEDGVGGGVVDHCGIMGFVNNSKALDDENYYNLQAQCGYRLAEHINSGIVGFKSNLLPEELQREIVRDVEQLQSWDVDSDGKLKLKPKDEIKKDTGHSPDWRDVLLMRCRFDWVSNVFVFNHAHIENLREGLTEPEATGSLTCGIAGATGQDCLKSPEFAASGNGGFRVWKFPDTETKVSDRYVAVYKPGRDLPGSVDKSVVSVIDRAAAGGKAEVVAQWTGNLDMDIEIWMAAQIAAYYGKALLVVIVRDDSEFIFGTVRDCYDNLYRRETVDRVTYGVSYKYGFMLNGSTLTSIVENYRAILREGGYAERDGQCLDEARTYVKDRKGNYSAMNGNGENILSARMTGLYVSGLMTPPKEITQITYRHRVRQSAY